MRSRWRKFDSDVLNIIAMPFTVEEATVDDAAAIAKVWLSAETSDFLRLQLGSVDLSVLSEGMTTRMEESICKEGQVYVVARDNDSNEIVSYAHWVLPKAGDDESGKMTAEVGLI